MKLSSNLSIEELIKLANSITDDESEEGLNHAERFIMSCNIVVGEDRVLPSIIWLKYLEWCEENLEKSVGKHKFWKQFDQHFTRQRVTSTRFYLLNKKVFNLSPKNQSQLTKIRKDHQYGKKD